jgi:hypothetical protein
VDLLRALQALGAGDGSEDEFIHYSACIRACIIWFSVVSTYELAW